MTLYVKPNVYAGYKVASGYWLIPGECWLAVSLIGLSLARSPCALGRGYRVKVPEPIFL